MIEQIVVGVDGSPASRAALRLAAEIAERFGAGMLAIECWEFTPLGALTSGPTDPREMEAAAEHRLGRTVREELGDPAPAWVTERVVEGTPASVLLEAAADADLVVVGSRGLGGFKGLLLGSVSQQVSSHSPAPVLIVHP